MAGQSSRAFPVLSVAAGIALGAAATTRGGVVITSAWRAITATALSVSDSKSSTDLGEYEDSVSISAQSFLCTALGQTDTGSAAQSSSVGVDRVDFSGDVSGVDAVNCLQQGFATGDAMLTASFTVPNSARWMLQTDTEPNRDGNRAFATFRIRTASGATIALISPPPGNDVKSGALNTGAYTLTMEVSNGYAGSATGTGRTTFGWSFKFLTACCMTDGSCVDAAPSDCSAQGGTPRDDACSPSPCGQPDVACCKPDGSCVFQVASQCTGGTPGPDGSVCSPNTCTQPQIACCFPDGSCVFETAAQCTGNPGPYGSVCTPNSCTQPLVACCQPDGSCVFRTAAQCTGGTPGPYGSVCSPNTCPQPQIACCQPDGSCDFVTAAQCTGNPRPYGSVCSPNPCSQPRIACCFSDGSCSFISHIDCSLQGGMSLAYGSVCDPSNLCQTGACCANLSCSVTIATQCTGATSRWIADASCNPPGNNISPCCKADINQSNSLTPQDVFDFLAAWFGKTAMGDFNVDGAVTPQDIFDYLRAFFAGCGG